MNAKATMTSVKIWVAVIVIVAVFGAIYVVGNSDEIKTQVALRSVTSALSTTATPDPSSTAEPDPTGIVPPSGLCECKCNLAGEGNLCKHRYGPGNFFPICTNDTWWLTEYLLSSYNCTTDAIGDECFGYPSGGGLIPFSGTIQSCTRLY